jgi:hypothetical protein
MLRASHQEVIRCFPLFDPARKCLNTSVGRGLPPSAWWRPSHSNLSRHVKEVVMRSFSQKEHSLPANMLLFSYATGEFRVGSTAIELRDSQMCSRRTLHQITNQPYHPITISLRASSSMKSLKSNLSFSESSVAPVSVARLG